MPIEMPTRTANANNRASHTDLVLCENFAFRPASVDGFSHQSFPDGSAITTVNFKGYTQSIADPKRRLLDFLVSTLQPHPADEDS